MKLLLLTQIVVIIGLYLLLLLTMVLISWLYLLLFAVWRVAEVNATPSDSRILVSGGQIEYIHMYQIYVSIITSSGNLKCKGGILGNVYEMAATMMYNVHVWTTFGFRSLS